MGTAVKYVAALNIDATLVKCYVYAVFRDSCRLEVVGSASDPVSVILQLTFSRHIDISPFSLEL